MAFRSSIRHDLTHIARGLLMGAADVVPGVSGGTVALVAGIYDRLVGALSRFDTQLLSHVRRREWRQAAQHMDLRFLIALGAGIASGILLCGGLVNTLLTQPSTRSATLAAFFGMIAASSVVVIRMIAPRTRGQCLGAAALVIIGTVVAYLVTSLPQSHVELRLWYVFLSAMIAICAMILPGISGAYVLLILGVYEPITGILKRLPKGEVDLNDLAAVAVFIAGCAIGLLSFSKLLKWLLARHEQPTMAVLAGFMIGAIHRVWPFQLDRTPDVSDLKHKIYEPYLPNSLTAEVLTSIVAALIAFALVLLLERVFHTAQQPLLEKEPTGEPPPARPHDGADV